MRQQRIFPFAMVVMALSASAQAKALELPTLDAPPTIVIQTEPPQPTAAPPQTQQQQPGRPTPSSGGESGETGGSPAVAVTEPVATTTLVTPTATTLSQRASVRQQPASGSRGLSIFLCLDSDDDGTCDAADPPLGDAIVSVNGQPYRTGSDGQVFVAVSRSGQVRVAVSAEGMTLSRDVSADQGVVVLAMRRSRAAAREGLLQERGHVSADSSPAPLAAPDQAQSVALPDRLPSLLLVGGGIAALAALAGMAFLVSRRPRAERASRPKRTCCVRRPQPRFNLQPARSAIWTRSVVRLLAHRFPLPGCAHTLGGTAGTASC